MTTENESPGVAVPATPGQAIRTQPQDRTLKATLQGSTAFTPATAAAPNWKRIAEEAWSAPSWKEAAADHHKTRNDGRRRPSADAIATAMRKQNPRDYVGLAPTFAAACRKADAEASLERPSEEILRARRLLDDGSSLERVWDDVNRAARMRYNAAPQPTVEALMYALRRGGTVLTDPNNARRLSELSEAQLHEVCARLQRFKPKIARPWTVDEVQALVTLWWASHHG